jgi:hypothetical protein
LKAQKFGGLLVDLVRSYDEAFERSLPSDDPKQGGAVWEAVQRAVLWVLGAGWGVEERQYLELQSGKTNDVFAHKTLKVCQNFFHLSGHDEIVMPHSSVRDYLSLKITHQVDRFIKFAKSKDYSDAAQESMLIEAKKAAASKAQEQIAMDCLDLMMSVPAVQLSGATSKKTPNSALHKFACLYWTTHFNAAMSSTEDPTALVEQGKALFKPTGRGGLQQWVLEYDKQVPWFFRADSISTLPIPYITPPKPNVLLSFDSYSTLPNPSLGKAAPSGKPFRLFATRARRQWFVTF